MLLDKVSNFTYSMETDMKKVPISHPLIHFYDQVITAPQKPLIIDHFAEEEKGVKIWSYQLIDHVSDQLATEIEKYVSNIKKTSTRQLRIGVAVETEVFYHIALLAIWKLGMVYVPLLTKSGDAIANRIKMIEMSLFITDHVVSQILNVHQTDDITTHTFAGVRCLNMDFLLQQKLIDLHSPYEKTNESIFNYRNQLSRRDLSQDAYIHASSGTTGTSKVIANSFLGLSGRVQGMSLRLNITDKSALLGFVAPQFDAHLLDFLMTFYYGAILYLVNYSIRNKYLTQIGDLFQIANTQYSLPVTHAVLLPTVLETLNNVCNHLDAFSTLEALVTMGEKCQPKTLEPWFKLKNISTGKPITIWNGYGPTETTIAATLTEIKADMQEFNMVSALPGVYLYLAISEEKIKKIIPFHILGEKDSKAISDAFAQYHNPPYLEGELYISGLGIGYYLNPDLDKQRYIRAIPSEKGLLWYHTEPSTTQDDFEVKSKGSKLEEIEFDSKTFISEEYIKSVYRSGDIVKMNPKGDLFFVERIDGYTKMNGKLVPLPEIEAIINNLKLVTIDAAKVAIEDNQIIACVLVKKSAINHNKQLNQETIKSLLNAFIQKPHLRPKFFFYTTEFKTKEGSNKFDFKDTLKHAQLVIRTDDRLCSSDLELKIANIWQTILLGDHSTLIEYFPKKR